MWRPNDEHVTAPVEGTIDAVVASVRDKLPSVKILPLQTPSRPPLGPLQTPSRPPLAPHAPWPAPSGC
eukprot:858995-Prorocentrum_minimum.AAC.1